MREDTDVPAERTYVSKQPQQSMLKQKLIEGKVE